MESNQEYVLRTYGDGTFGVGQIVVPGVAFFAKGDYGLTKAEAQLKLKQARSGKRGQ